jgi:hypothetical protein
VAKVKSSELDVGFNSESEPEKGDKTLTQNPVPSLLPPRSILVNLMNQRKESLFHSQMWVKGTPLHFIINSGSQKNLISMEVIK